MTVMRQSSNRKTLLAVLCCLIFIVFLFIYYPVDGKDFEVWSHLRYGEHFISNLTWNIDHQQFSWTPTNGSWVNVSWIGSSIIYGFFKLASIQGLYFMQWLIFIAILFLFRRFVKSVNVNIDTTFFLAAAMVFISLNNYLIYITPMLFSSLFFTIIVFIFFHARRSGKPLFLLYPIVSFIWVNTHEDFFIGLFFIGLMLILEFFNTYIVKKESRAKEIKLLLISVLLSFAAVLINPYGINYLLNFQTYFSMYFDPSSTSHTITELWYFLLPANFNYTTTNAAWCAIFMMSSFLILNLYGYTKKRQYDLTVLILNLIFFCIGMQYGRFFLYYPPLWFVSMFHLIHLFEVELSNKARILAFTIFMILIINALFLQLRFVDERDWYKRDMTNWLPIKEVTFIKQNKIPGPIFNSYSLGSYLIWNMYPEYKVFLDSRNGIYDQTAYADWSKIRNTPSAENFKAFTDKYQFRSAIVLLSDYTVLSEFLNSPDWKLLYFEKVAAVFVRSDVSSQLTLPASDLSTDRFKNVKNQVVLLNLFDLYTIYGPEFKQRILDIYKSNIDDLFFYKELNVAKMELIIQTQKMSIRMKMTK